MLDIRERRHLQTLRLEIEDKNSNHDAKKYECFTSDSGTLTIDNKFFVFFDWYEDVNKIHSH